MLESQKTDDELGIFEEDYLHLIKSICAQCHETRIPGTWYYYRTKGNFCLKCIPIVNNTSSWKSKNPYFGTGRGKGNYTR